MTGTSNLTDILHDPTGNRRIWIWVDGYDEDNPIDIADLEDHLTVIETVRFAGPHFTRSADQQAFGFRGLAHR